MSSFLRSMHFCWKRHGVTLWNKLGFTEFHFHGNFINFHHFPLQTGIHRHGIFGKRLPSGKVETGWNVVVKLYTSHSLGRWILYSPCIPSQSRHNVRFCSTSVLICILSFLSFTPASKVGSYHWEEHHEAASESMHQWMGLDTSPTSVSCCLGQLP